MKTEEGGGGGGGLHTDYSLKINNYYKNNMQL